MARPDLSTALENTAIEPAAYPKAQAERCVRSFKEYMADTSNAVNDVLKTDRLRPFAILWVVAEDGRISSSRIVKTSTASGSSVHFRSAYENDDATLDAASTQRFNELWHKVLVGDMVVVTDVADGSCTLVYDGRRARLFPPRYGVAADGGDALQMTIDLLDSAAQH